MHNNHPSNNHSAHCGFLPSIGWQQIGWSSIHPYSIFICWWPHYWCRHPAEVICGAHLKVIGRMHPLNSYSAVAWIRLSLLLYSYHSNLGTLIMGCCANKQITHLIHHRLPRTRLMFAFSWQTQRCLHRRVPCFSWEAIYKWKINPLDCASLL